jgi:hypothetical protein
MNSKASIGRPARIISLMTFSVAVVFTATRASAGSAEEWAKMKPIQPVGYVCYRAKIPIQIDGRLDDGAWKPASWTDDFSDIEGSRKPKPRFRTRAKMLWDEQYFYIAAELEEPQVWGTLTNHDAVIFQDNDFEVFIDPDGDNHEYYEFEINALNTGWDLLLKKPYKDGGPALNEWEIPGLKTAVHVRGTLNDAADKDESWTVEMAFPWKALSRYAHRPAPPREGDQWRVNFSRVEWLTELIEGSYRKVPDKREDNWVWSPQGIIDMHRPEKWGYVQFTQTEVATFRPDPALPARDLLQEIYYAQRDYKENHTRWAQSLDELGVGRLQRPTLVKSLDLKSSMDGFQVTAELSLPGGENRRLHIREDSRIWIE